MIDAHNHLYSLKEFEDIPSLMRRARQAGIMRMLCNTARESDWEETAHLMELYPGEIIGAFGIHPWYVKETESGWMERLASRLGRYPEAVIGETGLDFHHHPESAALQEEFFLEHLKLGALLRRPVSIHCVRSWEGLLGVFKKIPRKALPPALHFHAYNGGKELLEKLLGLGGWFSFAGTVLYEKNRRGREALQQLFQMRPDRLLLETDAPDLPAPEPYRMGLLKDSSGRGRSEPADLRLILGGVSAFLQVEEEELEEQIEANFEIFLKVGNV
ncbi:MAG: TatD family hydrolase [Limisphaerales bacterium]|jgi:TatD DNase family protein